MQKRHTLSPFFLFLLILLLACGSDPKISVQIVDAPQAKAIKKAIDSQLNTDKNAYFDKKQHYI